MNRIEAALSDIDDTETIALIDAEYTELDSDERTGPGYVKNDIRAKEAP